MAGRTSCGMLASALATAWALALSVPAVAQRAGAAQQGSAGPAIFDGVFTDVQAERGRAAFAASCVRCHKEDLSGDPGPPLKGEVFLQNWEGESLNSLFAKVRDTMPPNFGLLEASTKLDIVAYLLTENGYPAGPAELTQDPDALDAIVLVDKDTTMGVPNFSLVQAVGCLTHGANDAWMLTRTSEPVATRDDEPMPEALKGSMSTPLGENSFLLINVARFDPASHEGQKLEARGLLYRAAGRDRINLTSLRPVSATCAE